MSADNPVRSVFLHITTCRILAPWYQVPSMRACKEWLFYGTGDRSTAVDVLGGA